MFRNIGYTAKALSGISGLRDTSMDSDMTKQLQGTKTDFMGANRVPLGKNQPGTRLIVSQSRLTRSVRKVTPRHAPEPQDIWGTLRGEELTQI